VNPTDGRRTVDSVGADSMAPRFTVANAWPHAPAGHVAERGRLPMLCVITVKGSRVEFESPYSDDEAICTLRGLMARGHVMSSIASDLLRRMDGDKRLSRVQLNWVHKLVLDAEERHRNRVPSEVGTGQSRAPGSHRSSWPGS
jgi:hypothetical protein